MQMREKSIEEISDRASESEASSYAKTAIVNTIQMITCDIFKVIQQMHINKLHFYR